MHNSIATSSPSTSWRRELLCAGIIPLRTTAGARANVKSMTLSLIAVCQDIFQIEIKHNNLNIFCIFMYCYWLTADCFALKFSSLHCSLKAISRVLSITTNNNTSIWHHVAVIKSSAQSSTNMIIHIETCYNSGTKHWTASWEGLISISEHH